MSEVKIIKMHNLAPMYVQYEAEDGHSGGNIMVWLDFIDEKVYSGDGCEMDNKIGESILVILKEKKEKMIKNMTPPQEVIDEAMANQGISEKQYG